MIRPLCFTLLFTTALPAADKPVVIAHRGASGYLPEHTLEAKAMAHAQGADFIEQDVVLTKDDIPVVLHDIHVDAVSDVAKVFPDRHRDDGRYYALDFTLAELRTLRFTERFTPKTGKPVYPKRFPLWKADFRIATFEEDLQLIAGLNASTGRSAGIYPEIKQPQWHRGQGHDISAIVLPILKQYGYSKKTDACWVQCFEWEEVKRIRHELKWEGRLLLLMGGGAKGKDGTDFAHLRTAEGMAEAAKTVDGLGPDISNIIKGSSPSDRSLTSFVTQAHASGLQVHPYTLRVDDLPKTVSSFEDGMQLLIQEAKADGLFTDFPDLSVRWMNNHR